MIYPINSVALLDCAINTKRVFKKNKVDLSEMMRHRSSSTCLGFSYSSLEKGSHMRK